MKTFTIEVIGKEIPVYVDTLTKQMAIRFGIDGCNMFEICCDFHHGLWLTNIGIYGDTIEELVTNYIYYKNPRLSHVKHIYVCDDMQVFDVPSEPVNGRISYNEVKEVDSIKW